LDNDPFGKIGKRAVTVDVTSVVRASDRSFRIAWIEHPYADGTPLPVENWSAILTVVIQTPRTEVLLRQNPLGIFIAAISWAQGLGGHEP
jgi:type IV secretion system protein VirB5